jgi:hypothetical protein
VDRTPGRLVVTVDGEAGRELRQAPDHPVQLIIGAFDFPARAAGRAPGVVAGPVVLTVRGETLSPRRA